MSRTLRRLAELSVREWLLLPQLVLLAWAAGLAARRVGLPGLTGRLARWAGHGGARRLPAGHEGVAIPRLARLVDAAARAVHGPDRCLPRSLLLWWCLRARRVDAELAVGVRREGRALAGHAWVRTARGPVADTPDGVAAFTVVFRA